MRARWTCKSRSVDAVIFPNYLAGPLAVDMVVGKVATMDSCPLALLGRHSGEAIAHGNSVLTQIYRMRQVVIGIAYSHRRTQGATFRRFLRYQKLQRMTTTGSARSSKRERDLTLRSITST